MDFWIPEPLTRDFKCRPHVGLKFYEFCPPETYLTLYCGVYYNNTDTHAGYFGLPILSFLNGGKFIFALIIFAQKNIMKQLKRDNKCFGIFKNVNNKWRKFSK